MIKKKYIVSMIAGMVSIQLGTAEENILQFLDKRAEKYAAMSYSIWGWAEVGYQEEKTTELMQSHLRDEGFSINAGVADIPTAFIASYGSGKPVIAILAEMDALPGLSQSADPERNPIKDFSVWAQSERNCGSCGREKLDERNRCRRNHSPVRHTCGRRRIGESIHGPRGII